MKLNDYYCINTEEKPLDTLVEDGGFGSRTCVPVVSKVLQECMDVMDGQ